MDASHHAPGCEHPACCPPFVLIGLPDQFTWTVRSDAEAITNVDRSDRSGKRPDEGMGYDGITERQWRFTTQCPVDRLQMVSKEIVEFRIRIGGLIFTKPPEPIAPFRSIKRFERFGMTLRRCLDGIEPFPGFAKAIPSTIFLDLADPGAEIVPRPRAVLVNQLASNRS